MRGFLQLLKKDLLLEWRGRESLSFLLCLAILLSMIVAVGVNNAFVPPPVVLKLYAPMLWIISVFSATLAIGRSYEHELDNMALEGLVLGGAAPGSIFLAKTACNFLLSMFGHCVSMLSLAALLDVNILDFVWLFLLLSVLVTAGYAALGTLLAAVSVTSRLRGMLLPLILLPLLFPLYFAALELSAGVIYERAFDTASFWFVLLLALDVLYIVLGINLYEFVIRD